MSCLIRDDLHLRAHLRSKEHLLTPAVKEIRRTRAELVLQWQDENRHENIFFTDEKFFTIEEQYNNQNKICAQTSLEVHSEGAGMPSPFLCHGLVGGVPSGADTSSFLQERVETGVRVCIKRTCYKELCNSLTWPFSVVRNGSSGRTQLPLKSQDYSGVAAEERPDLYQRRGLTLGESRPQPPGLKLWTVLEDMACWKRHNNLDSLKRSLMKAAAEIPLETVRAAIAEWPESLKACIEAEGGHFEWDYYK